jgi:hypothetical protein
MQAYSDPSREDDEHALPDLEIFQMTADEVATSGQYDDEIAELMRQPGYRLASMNGRARDALIAALIEEQGISGGWFYWYCFPGCLPDSAPMGPYDTAEAARTAAREECV